MRLPTEIHTATSRGQFRVFDCLRLRGPGLDDCRSIGPEAGVGASRHSGSCSNAAARARDFRAAATIAAYQFRDWLSRLGAEYTFSFQNMNVERGLLWNQENAINRGVQLNQTLGKFTASLSYNDGFYSNRYNWLTGALTYVNGPHSLAFTAGGNLGQTNWQSLRTPIQNNSMIYDLIYTYTKGPWVIQPYVQYTDVPTNLKAGIPQGASTLGRSDSGQPHSEERLLADRTLGVHRQQRQPGFELRQPVVRAGQHGVVTDRDPDLATQEVLHAHGYRVRQPATSRRASPSAPSARNPARPEA